jgi:hypothetical protein
MKAFITVLSAGAPILTGFIVMAGHTIIIFPMNGDMQN